MASTGTMNPLGVLHAGLSMAATLLKTHVVLMESINSLLKRVVVDCPHISLELLSARVSLKKHLGFASDPVFGEHVGDGHQQKIKPANPWKLTKDSGLARVQPRLMESKSFKLIRPFALMLSDRLLPLIADCDLFVQRVDRWKTPSPLTRFPISNISALNYDDRPFAFLPVERRSMIAIASVFHKEWFNDLKTSRGQLMLIAFCSNGTGTTRLRSKTSLLDKAYRVFLVGEIHSRQARVGLRVGSLAMGCVIICFI